MINHPLFRTAKGQLRAERYGHWLKAGFGNVKSLRWCIDNGVGLVKAESEVTDSAGGFLTPTDFDSDVISIKETQGAFRRGAQVVPSTSDHQVRPRRVQGLTANFVAEGASIPTSQGQYDAVTTTSKKMGILVTASSELLEDSAVDLGAWIASEVAYAFAGSEDDCGFNGTGTSQYAGISGLSTRLAGTLSAIPATAGHNTFAALTGVDVTALMGGVLGSALPGAAWYVSQLGFATCLAQLAATTGGLAVSVSSEGAGPIAINYLGWPVYISSKLPNVSTTLANLPMMYFGNLAQSSVIVERRQTVIGMSRQHLLDSDQVLIRATQRLDIVCHDCGSATVKGPMAVLLGTT
jgi:HK97 family phage major capsid protein